MQHRTHLRQCLAASALVLTTSIANAACDQLDGGVKVSEATCRVIQEVTATWEAFRSSLSSSDCQDSLKHLNFDTRAKYEPQLCKEGTFARALLANCREFGVKEIYTKTVSAVALCTTQAGKVLAPLEFGRRTDGTWAITSM